MATTETNQLLTAAEVAERLRVSLGMVYKLAASGELPSVRVGSAVRIPVAGLDGYVEERSRSWLTRGSAA